MGTVGVVGGGVAGLAAAHYLLRKPSVTRCVDCQFVLILEIYCPSHN